VQVCKYSWFIKCDGTQNTTCTDLDMVYIIHGLHWVGLDWVGFCWIFDALSWVGLVKVVIFHNS